jgi:4-hydroxybenzoate polyprenyltransferase
MLNSTDRMKVLGVVRPLNLLFLAGVQSIIHFGLLFPANADLALDLSGFVLLVLASVLIAAGGYTLNDIQDQEIDAVNRPATNAVGNGLSERQANNLYIGLTTSGVAIGFYLSQLIDRPVFATVFVGVAALLYAYSIYFSAQLLLGNLFISLLVAMGLIVVPIFDLVPTTDWSNRQWHASLFRLVLLFSALAFLLNFIREIVKDQQDLEGDRAAGRRSLPSILGQKRTNMLVVLLMVILILAICGYLYIQLYQDTEVLAYFFLGVISPLTFLAIRVWYAKDPQDYAVLSNLLKLIMLTGMLGMLAYPLVVWK